MGYEAGSYGNVLVDGAGSIWANTGSLHIGSVGTGSVIVSGGAILRADAELLINRFAAGDGTLIANGPGSLVITNGEIRIADEGTGSLRIENGATVITDLRTTWPATPLRPTPRPSSRVPARCGTLT